MTEKQWYAWATPSGPINLMKAEDMPVDPVTINWQGERKLLYTKDTKQIEAAKESSVPIQDQDEAWRIIFPDLKDACEFEVVGDSISYKMGNYGIFALPIIPDTIHGPFTVEYEIQELHYCKLCGAYKSIKRIPCQNAYCGKTTERVAILYDDTPEEDIDTQFAESATAHIRNAPAKTYRAVPEEEPQEDQEALLDELVTDIFEIGKEAILEKFIITRKQ